VFKRILLLNLSTDEQQCISPVIKKHYECQFYQLAEYLKHPIHFFPDVIIINAHNPCAVLMSDVVKRLSNHLSKYTTNPTCVIPPLLAWTDANNTQRKALYELGFFDYFCTPLIAPECINRIELALLYASKVDNSETIKWNKANLVTAPTISSTNETNQNKEQLLAEKTANYLQKNLSKDIKLAEVAKSMATNRNKLSISFKAYYGVSIFTWLRQKRMQLAASLLVNTSHAVLLIAEQVGYFDANNFSTSFKREYQVSPIQFRKLAM